MNAELQLTPTPEFQLRPTMSLVAYAEMLALSADDFAERVAVELAENPALVRPEEAGRGGGEGLDWVPARPTQAERLLTDLRLALSTSDAPIAEYLVGSLGARGRLEAEPAGVAAAVGAPVDRVLVVLAALRRLGPPGIGARDLRECLTLQLDRWEEEHPAEPLVRLVVDRHLEALARGRLRTIATDAGVDVAAVAAARDFIRQRLRPYPLDSEPPDAPVSGVLPPDIVVGARPDRDGEFAAGLTEPGRHPLAVDPGYAEMAGQGLLSKKDSEHVREHVGRARAFIGQARQRWRTLGAVTDYAVRQQAAFLRDGSLHARPLTRVAVAQALGLHESTVSRAVAHKRLQLPTGRVIPFGDLFTTSLAAHETLRQVVAAEPHPLSDAELAAALASRGHRVARRTIAKYRGQLGIPAQAAR